MYMPCSGKEEGSAQNSLRMADDSKWDRSFLIMITCVSGHSLSFSLAPIRRQINLPFTSQDAQDHELVAQTVE